MNGPSELIGLIDQRIRAASGQTRAIGTCMERDIVGPGALVTFDGSTVAVPVKVLGQVVLRPSMRCTLDKYGTEWLVTGTFATPALGRATFYDSGTATSTTSTSFVGFGAMPTFDFIKYHDDSNVRIFMSGSCYASTNTARMRFAVRLVQTDGDTPWTPVDFVGPELRLDTLLVRQYGAADFTIPNTFNGELLPAGTYTCTWRWRRTNGTGTLNADTTDMFSMVIEEKVLPSSPYV